MELLCQRCQHQWDYKGTNPYYATCPYCKTKVRVLKSVVADEDNAEINK